MPNTVTTQAIPFLEMFHGQEGKLHIRAIPERPGLEWPTRSYVGTLSQNITGIQAANDAGYGIFVGINAGGFKDSEITEIRAAYIDLDRKDFADEETFDQAVRYAATGRKTNEEPPAENWPCATAVIQTGAGAHAHWRLKSGTCPVAQFKPLQQALVKKFGGDPAVVNPARLMRVPGFAHWKTGNPLPVKMIHHEPERSYTLDELLEGFGISLDNSSNVAPSVPFGNTRPDTPENVAGLRDALTRINADCSYPKWIKVLMGIKSHGFAEGEEIARKWSMTALHRYAEESFQKTWDSLKVDGGITPSSIYYWANTESCPDFTTDAGMACRFEKWANGNVMYANSALHMWDGSCWKQNEMGVKKLLMDFAEKYKKEGLKKYIHNPAYQKPVAKAAKDILSTNRQKTVLEAIKTRCHVSDELLNADPMLLAVPNGEINLKTGELLPSNRESYHMRCAGVQYDPNAQCPLFLEFMNQTFQGDQKIIEYLQRCAGYMLTGSVKEEKIFFGHGGGRNGKSVLANVLAYVMGTYAGQADSSLLSSGKRDSGAASPDVARLAGLRLVLVNETKAGERWDDSKVKSLVSTEKIVARGLYREPFEFTPTAKLFVRGNHKPVIKDASDGMWRRMALIPFRNKVSPDQKDGDLDSKLEAEGAGILAWMVRGCLEWQRQGLNPPTNIVKENEQYRSDEDDVAEWAEACLDSGGWTSRKDLRESYARYRRLPQLPVGNEIYERLRHLGFNEKKTNGNRSFEVSLRPEGAFD